MKKILLLLTLSFGASALFAQTTDLKKLPTLGINFFLKDFKTAEAVKNTSLSNVLVNKTYGKPIDMAPGVSITYLQGLTDHVDFMATLGGTFTKYKRGGVNLTGSESFLLDLDAQVNAKLLTDKYFFVPYLTAGIGASMYKGSYFMANVPVGGGFQFKLGEGSFLYTQAVYKIGVSDLAKENFTYSIGFASPIVDRKAPVVVAPPPPPPAPVEVEKDTDNDGIVDSKDKCPTVAGTAKYDGCPVPDTDNDGINDENDKCITVAGLAKYNGCPIPDTDKDGINDETDKCPTVAGVARYQGCPIPDGDGDGVNDEEDKCPTEAGTKANSGCPEIQTKIAALAKSVFFTSGSVKVTPASTKPLDEVIEILKKYPNANIEVEGHTDNVGSAKINKTLSQKRADAIKAYIVKKGVTEERIKATGFGSEQPIADNKTTKGKAENRRVEIKATYEFK